jgi:hypothetical protein
MPAVEVPLAPVREPAMRRLEFLLCGSPNDAFYSQLAMFRLSLDSLGPLYRSARVVMCLGAAEREPLPARWRPYFRDIEVVWAPLESFLEFGDGEDHLFTLIDPDADLSFICDADTLLLAPWPVEFIDSLIDDPAICGTIAHLAPAMFDRLGHDYRALGNEPFWQALAGEVLGRPLPLDHRYTLRPEQGACPFYVNYGFVAGTPALLGELHRQLSVVQPAIRRWLDNDFYGQLGIALAVERGNIPHRALPMRYNFPNDQRAETMCPDDLADIKLLHYLRRDHFDRHLIFATNAAFDGFLNTPLQGSDAVFQRHVAQLTANRYPFPAIELAAVVDGSQDAAPA